MESIYLYRARHSRSLQRGWVGQCGSPTPRAGFTLVELMVMTAIIGIITVIAFLNQNNFNKILTLVNTSYDIALTFRSTQGLGLGNSISGSALNVGYGVHFDSANPSSFIVFADSHGSSCPTTLALDCQPGNKAYTSSDTTVRTVSIGNGIQISKFCVLGGPGTRCTDVASPLTFLDIVFTRPNSDVSLFAGGSGFTSFGYSSACLTLTSPAGGTRNLKVTASGSIVAQASSCP